jgi:hypothetical protein
MTHAARARRRAIAPLAPFSGGDQFARGAAIRHTPVTQGSFPLRPASFRGLHD